MKNVCFKLSMPGCRWKLSHKAVVCISKSYPYPAVVLHVLRLGPILIGWEGEGAQL